MTFTPKVLKVAPSLIPEKRFARNGKVPSTAALNRIVHALNNAAHYTKRPVSSFYASGMQNYDGIGTAGAPTLLHSFCMHTSENADKLVCSVIAESATSAGNSPSVYVTVDDGSSTTDSNVCTYAGKGTYYPDSSGTTSMLVPARLEAIVAVDPDTEYVCHIYAYDNLQMKGFTAWERGTVDATDALVGITASKPFEVGKACYYQDAQALLEAATELWRHNAATAFSLTPIAHTGGYDASSVTYVNVIDTARTAFHANAPGVHIRSTYHNSRSETTVPYKLMCFGSRTGGTGTLSIKLVKSGGTVHEWTGITDTWSPFQSTTFTHAALDEKVDILVKVSDGTTTFDIDNIALIEYEA